VATDLGRSGGLLRPRAARSLLSGIARARWLPAALGPLQALVPGPRRNSFLVVALHLVNGGTGLPVDIDRSEFEELLDSIAEYADPVSLADAMDGSESHAEESNGGKLRFVLTVDDAFRNFSEEILPLLVERDLPATLFVPVDFVEGARAAPLPCDLPALTWDELREIQSSGIIEIGSHTCAHLNLPGMKLNEIAEDLARASETLSREMDREISSFCYPRGLWSAAAAGVVGQFHETAVIGGGRWVQPSSVDRLRIPRFPAKSGCCHIFRSLLGSRVWLQEYVADKARHSLARRGLY